MSNLYDTIKEKQTIVGYLNMGMPFLSKTHSGNIYTPSFFVDENYNFKNAIKNANNLFYTYRDGIEELLFIVNDEIDFETAVLKTLSIAKKDYNDSKSNKDPEWYKIRAWGDIAMQIHLNFKKGDLVNAVIVPGFDENNNKIWDVLEIKLISR